MNYTNNTYNYTNPEYSATLSLVVDKNIIQYGNNYIPIDSISSITPSQIQRNVSPLFKKIIGIILLIYAISLLVNGYSKCIVYDVPDIETIIVEDYNELNEYIESRNKNAKKSFDYEKYAIYLFFSATITIISIFIFTSKNHTLHYLSITQHNGNVFKIQFPNKNFLQECLTVITTIINEKTPNIYYAINFKKCSIIKGIGNINNIQGNNNTIGG